MNPTRLFLFLVFIFSSNFLFSQRQKSKTHERINFGNEVFSTVYMSQGLLVYGLGYERNLIKKGKHFFSLQNEFSTTIAPSVENDGQKLYSTVKWNRQQTPIISLGLGSVYKFTKHNDKLSLLFTSSCKYIFSKQKMSISGNILIFLNYQKPPNPQSGLISGSICGQECYRKKLVTDGRFNFSVGKYF
jgi:hypothetical protein